MSFPVLIGSDREGAAFSSGEIHSKILLNLTIKISLNNFIITNGEYNELI